MCVEQRAAGVEAVADLVTDGRADRAVVEGRVRIRVEEGLHQDRRVFRSGKRRVQREDPADREGAAQTGREVASPERLVGAAPTELHAGGLRAEALGVENHWAA